MKYPDNWEQMTIEEKEKWAYLNSTPEGRFSTRTKEAGEKLVRLILEDEELLEIRIAELRAVFERAEKQLKVIYGQTTLRQAISAFETLPEGGCSYPRTGFPK